MIKRLKPKSEFSRNVLTLMMGTTIAQAIPIAISPILTRIYTPDDFGVFALFLALVGIFSSIASGRYEMAIMLPKKDDDAINIFALGLLIITIITIVLFLIVCLFHTDLINILNTSSIDKWLYFIPITVFFMGFFNLLSLFSNRIGNYKEIAKAQIVKSIGSAIIQLSIGFFKSGVTGLISGQIISNILANTKLLQSLLHERNFTSKIKIFKMIVLAKKYKKFPLYQVPHAFLNTLASNIPVYMFSIFFSSMVVGIYSLSTRIVFTPLMIIAGASSKVYNQKVTELYNNGGDAYGFTLKLLASLFKKIIIPFILIILFAPDIFAFIFGEIWRDAGVYTQLLSPWIFMTFFVTTISFLTSLMSLQKKALFLEGIYFCLRVLAIMIGIYYNDVHIALIYFSIVGFCMLSYNMVWMLNALKGVK
ncbi:oligosaccharide flippase family protein [Sulfurimonas aquatica]|uniref:Oligosaccharide flippase family protein n=1 Tax=Sulfurimonas aquatica TaxID=2672570 RepID=A0A975GCM7_9BACT|nr:lipopolysaccharide biosynthesis protein [Sulfurimonas aquatica]QSZ41439.1 oligosaccharide flippase family protein [Sulfurimonas aquatica]